MASLSHPLLGCTPGTLFKLLLANGPVARDCWPHVALFLAASVARWPFSTAERLVFEAIRRGQPPLADPIFIVGYWRSGTTHLHNLMAQSGQFGYITPLATGMPWDILGLVSWLEPLLEQALPENRSIDNVAVTPTSPQEDSIPLATMGATSYYHGLYFPHHFEDYFRREVLGEMSDAELAQWRRLVRILYEKVSMHQGHRPLLIKNPVYTGYGRHLREMWPKAKFIHIYRNPYRVFLSTRHFFNGLLPELALQSYGELPIDKLILESYPVLMEALGRDTADLPPNQFVELSFEALEANPLQELEKIYRQLELPNFETAHPLIEQYLAGLAAYQKNEYTLDDATRTTVDQHWGSLVQKYSNGHWG